MSKEIILSGIRPTGKLHIGNYLGALKNFVELQNKYECYFFIADLHSLNETFDPKIKQEQIFDLARDFLAAGLDPKKCTIFVQSHIPEHSELAIILSNIIPVSFLFRMTQYKEKSQGKESVSVGVFDYPALMAADILIYKASAVPVGIDQEPHLEIAREIARKMNEIYGTDFPQPRRFETEAPYVPSLTGEGKMSKSVEGSYINLTDSLAVIRNRLAAVPTDSGKGEIKTVSITKFTTLSRDKFRNQNRFLYLSGGKESPGIAVLMEFVELFQGKQARLQYQKQYQSAGIQYNKLKIQLAEAIFKQLEPIQKRRREFESDPAKVEKILAAGAARARAIAQTTVSDVRQKIGLK